MRRLHTGFLIAATLAAAAAPHRHEFLADDGALAAHTQVVTAHDSVSGASHIHAILRVLEHDPCWTCQFQRHLGPPASHSGLAAMASRRVLAVPPPRAAVSIARFTRLSRGPPSLPASTSET